MKAFDKKFGPEFVAALPAGPGVYRIYDSAGSLIYVGKAKSLRRRLSQYRNAKRRKKSMKMRSIVKDADRIEVETCVTELDACLLETRLIQEHRPRWNVAGAFHFLYPMIGMRFEHGIAYFCYTTEPAKYPAFQFHGAFRSRDVTREAFFSLMRLLTYVGHQQPGRSRRERFSYVFAFRQLPAHWLEVLAGFWRGESCVAIENLILALVENAGARRARSNVQEHFDQLKRFWKHEAMPLARARRSCEYAAYPVSQADRDLIFLKHRHSVYTSVSG